MKTLEQKLLEMNEDESKWRTEYSKLRKKMCEIYSMLPVTNDNHNQIVELIQNAIDDEIVLKGNDNIFTGLAVELGLII